MFLSTPIKDEEKVLKCLSNINYISLNTISAPSTISSENVKELRLSYEASVYFSSIIVDGEEILMSSLNGKMLPFVISGLGENGAVLRIPCNNSISVTCYRSTSSVTSLYYSFFG